MDQCKEEMDRNTSLEEMDRNTSNLRSLRDVIFSLRTCVKIASKSN